MSAVIASIAAVDSESAIRAVEGLPASAAPVELRADRLSAEEVAEIVGSVEREWIVTVRRSKDGGLFDADEAAREALLRRALDAGARWVDVEFDGPLAGWADGPDAARTILSHHGAPCRIEALRELYEKMVSTRADRLKIVARPESPAEVVALRDLLCVGGERLCAFGLGAAGAISRLLAPSWGSWGTYAAVRRGAETAAGQFTVDDLQEVYDVSSVGPGTRLVALAGSHILPSSPSPAMHNVAYRVLGLDRLYVPLVCESWDDVEAATVALDLQGLAVTLPFKTDAAESTVDLDTVSTDARAANTLVLDAAGRNGANTDGPAAVACLETRGLGPIDDVDILGGGGTARAIAAALVRSGRRPSLWTRSRIPGECVPPGVAVGRMAERIPGESDWLVNATPLRDGSLLGDGPPARRGVLDVVYGGEPTALIRRAEECGLAAVDGFELLVAQAERQFRLHTGRNAPSGLLAEAGQRYLATLG